VPEEQHGSSHPIVAGVDGSPSPREALRWTVRQAELAGATVDAVIAWQPPAASGLGWGLSVADDTDYGEVVR
jgi:Universal stress protein family